MTATEAEPKEFDLQDPDSVLGGLFATPDPSKFFAPIQALGLESHIAELDAIGYTVIPPEKVMAPELLDRLRTAVLRISQQRTGVEFHPDRNPALVVDQGVPNSVYQFYLLFEDEAFEEWIENETLGALVDYTLRGQGQLSSMSSILKWEGGTYGPSLGLHSDASGSPEGSLPTAYDAICNGALCLSDYTREGGAIAMVPGSHRFARQPRPGDGVDAAVPVEAPAGSLIFWRGNMWHGAFPRTVEGLRMTITNYFCHRSFKTQENYQGAVPDQFLARHSERVARFLGADDFYGWGKEGPGPGAVRAATYKQLTRDAQG